MSNRIFVRLRAPIFFSISIQVCDVQNGISKPLSFGEEVVPRHKTIGYATWLLPFQFCPNPKVMYMKKTFALLALGLSSAMFAGSAMAECGCAATSAADCGGCADTAAAAPCSSCAGDAAGDAVSVEAVATGAGCGQSVTTQTVMVPQQVTEAQTVTVTEMKQETRQRSYTVSKSVPRKKVARVPLRSRFHVK